MQRLTLIVALAAVASCVGRGAPVLIPVRVDTTHAPPREVVTTPTRPVVTVDADPFHRLDRSDWPGPNQYRGADGAPGPAYWQQRADYTIVATLDTAAKTIRGSVSIRYTNNSPDTLRFVWLQLDQNLYRRSSKGAALFPTDSRPGSRPGPTSFHGGFDVTGIEVDGRPGVGRIDDTMMQVELDAPLAPRGGVATIGMQFAFEVPERGSDRMGRDSALYEIAQWYPRVVVYDDVRGWNADPYLGQGEFYLEYGTIDYSVTVPAGYVVAGTGTLQNRGAVLTPAQLNRLEQAAHSSSVIPVITAEEAAAARRRAVAGTRTWWFHAERVRDVAWAAAPDFRWDAAAWDGIITQALYEFPKAGRAWESAAEQTQWAIRMYSDLWARYPYPQATTVAGPVPGMEYPMFVMAGYGGAAASSTFDAIDHEQGHEWFPMLVGSNERRYAWMDEGLDTYQNAFSSERRSPGTDVFPRYLAEWRASVDDGRQSPLMTPPDRVDPAALGAIGYRKPGAVLLALRDDVIGRETMDRAMREYVRRWSFKHPAPGDFFRTVENVSGQDLSWFWRAFFYGTDVLDIALDGVAMRQANGHNVVEIYLRRVTTVPFPVTVRLRFDDRTTQDVRLPVEIWARGDRYVASLPVERPVVGARLWPDQSVPDWNASNDVWGDAPAADAHPASTGGGIAPPIPPPPGRQ